MAQIIERVDAHYEAREVPFGKVYEWHRRTSLSSVIAARS
jgi:hypothetical protein